MRNDVATRFTRAVRIRLILFLVALIALPTGLVLAAPASAHPEHSFTALVFSKTAGFRHGSIPAGIAAIQKLATEHEFTVEVTEDGAAFTDENLARFDVVIWLSTTGDVLNTDQQAAFERYVRDGGGYAGVHAASDTEYDWPWYGDLVGAYFKNHPEQQDATVKIEDPAHPSTAGLAPTWDRFDEWYNYRTNPRGAVHVLASLDETSYSGGEMGAEHPISWCQDYDGGRSWYTGMGHTDESFSDPAFLTHLLGGIRTAAGVEKADCAATLTGSFEKVTLDDNTANPMDLAVAEDGRVLYADRKGEVKLIQPNGNVSVAGKVDVYTGQEFGLLGIALDPKFATTHHVYLYYSPAGDAAVDRVSRFTLDGDRLDPDSEKVVLTLDVQRQECCHAGGALEFDDDGNLYIATGDNTNPFASSGFAPIDEQSGRAAWDAQRTSANTRSLSGKVLRITPQPDGSYTVPAGNLFSDDDSRTRPEIYAMGFRNPFRIGLDAKTGHLLVADYGPDAGAADPARGPDGRVEWNILSRPGFYGWPYCVGNNTPYRDFDFATQTSGPAFDCSAPKNTSPNNTGLTDLPAAVGTSMWQGSASTGVPEIGGSGAPMTSGVYDYDADLESARKWPAYFDGKAIWGDWNNGRLFTVQLDQDRTGYTDVNRFLEGMAVNRPHALQFGPDGALYLIEWGSGFGGDNTDSGVYRIDYVQGNRAPLARATATPTSGPAPLAVRFDGSASSDPDGSPLTYAWDVDGDGTTDSTEVALSHTYTEVGDYTARLTVTDADGRTSVSNLSVVVGNTAPTVELVLPVDGGLFEFGDTIRYQVKVTDPEDGTIDCDGVVVQPALGHDEHAHGYEQYHGCSGVLPLPGDAGHIGANIFGTVTATYTDRGAAGTSALSGQDTAVLHTKRTEAEFFDRTGRLSGSDSGGDPGVVIEATGDSAGGGQNLGYIEPGDWFGWDRMNLTAIDTISMRVASPSTAEFAVRTGNPDTGPTVARIAVAGTGDWQVYRDAGAPPSGASTTTSGPLFFVLLSGQANVNWIDFQGQGVTEGHGPPQSCFSGRSDDFLGTTLDHGRWSSIVRENQDYSVADGQLHLPLTATDIYQAGSPTPNLVLQPLPAGRFEVTTKLTLAARRAYQQAGLILYGDDDNYLKLVLSGRSDTPNAATRVVQFLSETAAVAAETNSPDLGSAFPDSIWLRMTSLDGVNVSASYSADGQSWTAIAGTRTRQAISTPRIGVFGMANQSAALPVTAHFDHFRITPDDTAIPPEDCPGTGTPDNTAPTLSVDGLSAGDQLSVADRQEVTVTAEDETTAHPVLTLTLDGEPATTPLVLDGVDLLSGPHTLTVRAVDAAGNRTEKTIAFTVVAGWDSGTALIDRLAQEKHLPRSMPVTLRTQWRTARAAAGSGLTEQARTALEQFSGTAAGASDARSRTALVDLADQLSKQLTTLDHPEKRTT